MDEYQMFCGILKDEQLPIAYIDIKKLDDNISDIISRIEGTSKTIRLASKSLRIPAMISKILEHDLVKGILAYSAPEAVYLSKQGFNNIIIAYPIVDPVFIENVLKEEKDIYLMVDSEVHVNIISQVATRLGIQAQLCVDIDLSTNFPGVYFGVYRSSIKKLEDVQRIGEFIKNTRNVTLEAVMGYEAQIAGVADKSPARNFIINSVIRLLKKRSIRKISEFRKQAVNLLKDQGHKISIVNGGGTGSVSSTKVESCVTEVTVGSGFFSPAIFDDYNDFKYAPAMGFAIEITRNPQKDVYTAHGGGYIASGSIGIDKQPKIYLPRGAKFIPDEGCGEVQTPVKCKDKLQIGDPLILRHAKAGELSEHFNEVILIENRKIVDRVPTYRGLGKKFL